jgi:transcriptional regulator with XRE-family HTH domain
MNVDEITKKYREENDLTLEEFGQALAREIPGASTSKQLVSNWECGRQTPAYYFLISVVLAYSINPHDWRAHWAIDCLHALRPELWPAVENKRLPVMPEQGGMRGAA